MRAIPIPEIVSRAIEMLKKKSVLLMLKVVARVMPRDFLIAKVNQRLMMLKLHKAKNICCI